MLEWLLAHKRWGVLEWLLAFRMFLAFWLCPGRTLDRVERCQIYNEDPCLAADFVYVFRHTGHVAECDGSAQVGRATWLRVAWDASRTWYNG